MQEYGGCSFLEDVQKNKRNINIICEKTRIKAGLGKVFLDKRKTPCYYM